MRLMTVNSSSDGLIEISEAPDYAPQMIMFAVPVDIREIKKIDSSYELNNFLTSIKFYGTLYHQHDRENVLFNFELRDNRYSYVCNYRGSVIRFYVDIALNFNINQIKKFVRIGSKRRTSMEKAKQVMYRYLFRISLPFVKFKWQYVGTINNNRYRDNRFLILSMDSTQQLDLLFLQHKSFFVNPS